MTEKSIDIPLVSVIVPTLNNDRTIRKCLSSLENQTYERVEIIVVDGHSEDRTAQICEDFSVEIFQEKLQRSAARLFGAQQASGDYLFHVDSDMRVGAPVIDECVCRAKAGADALVIPESNLGKGLGSEATAFQKRYLAKCNRGYLRFVSNDVYFDVGGHHPELISGEDKYLHDKIQSRGYKIELTHHEILHNTGSFGFFDALGDRLNYSETTQYMIDELRENQQEESEDWNLLLNELASHPIGGTVFLFLEGFTLLVTKGRSVWRFFTE